MADTSSPAPTRAALYKTFKEAAENTAEMFKALTGVHVPAQKLEPNIQAPSSAGIGAIATKIAPTAFKDTIMPTSTPNPSVTLDPNGGSVTLHWVCSGPANTNIDIYLWKANSAILLAPNPNSAQSQGSLLLDPAALHCPDLTPQNMKGLSLCVQVQWQNAGAATLVAAQIFLLQNNRQLFKSDIFSEQLAAQKADAHNFWVDFA